MKGCGEKSIPNNHNPALWLYQLMKLVEDGTVVEGVTEPVFVNLLRSPGIDSQSDGPVPQPYLSCPPAKLALYVYKSGLRACVCTIFSLCAKV